MRKLSVYNTISLDGYFVDAHNDMNWAHRNDPEWNEFVAGNASGGGMLVLGRVTYDMMAGFWPTPFAIDNMPAVASRMNAMPKLVCSRTMTSAAWQNTRIVRDDIAAEIGAIKATSGEVMTILGSGSIVAQLAAAGLIDEYQLVLSPVALGGGRTLFAGLPAHLPLKRTGVRAFGNGNVVVTYTPAG